MTELQKEIQKLNEELEKVKASAGISSLEATSTAEESDTWIMMLETSAPGCDRQQAAVDPALASPAVPENSSKDQQLTTEEFLDKMFDDMFDETEELLNRLPGSTEASAQAAVELEAWDMSGGNEHALPDIEIVAISCKPWEQMDSTCHVCEEVFESRNRLFDHLEEKCLHGQLQRKTAGSHHKQLKSWRWKESQESRVRKWSEGTATTEIAQESRVRKWAEGAATTEIAQDSRVRKWSEGSAATEIAQECRVRNEAEGSGVAYA